MKESSDVLSLTYDEFCHIRNVITRAELETLLFDEKLCTEVAQGKVNIHGQRSSSMMRKVNLILVMFYLPESSF